MPFEQHATEIYRLASAVVATDDSAVEWLEGQPGCSWSADPRRLVARLA